jgi:hypothetical protein
MPPGPPDVTQAQRTALKRASLLSAGAILAIVLIGIVTLLIISRHRARQARGRQRRPGVRVDPWHEAGRRAAPAPVADDSADDNPETTPDGEDPSPPHG